MEQAGRQQGHTWRGEAQDLLRGLGGAAIIGTPLVYTMEMWQFATLLPPLEVVALMAAAVAVSIGYNYASGFRRDSGLLPSFYDALESYGLAVLFALTLLVLLRVVDGSTPPIDAACKIALEAIPLSIGVSIANTQFGENRQNGTVLPGAERRHPVLSEAGITLAGALIFAFNIAPTEEIMRLASGMTALHLLALTLFSLLLSYALISVAEFSGLERRRSSKGLLQSPLGETVLAYAIAVLVSLALICIFHDVSPFESPFTVAAATVVLGLPATIGGAAGRLIV